MNFGQWVLGAVAGSFALGAIGAQAAPIHRALVDAPASTQMIQYYYDDEPSLPPRGYYDPPPRPYYHEPRPRPYYESRPYYGPRPYDEPPPRRYGRPASPGYTVPTLPDKKGRQKQIVIYDKEEAKDYMKAYRKTQKEIYKENLRAQNRANGFR